MHLKTEIETTTTQQHKLHFEGEGAVAHELSQFNELLTCRICQGYMIEPTTVDYCYHTYCRSCILKHLLRDVYCPQCKGSGGKHISEDNLRSDDTMRSLIYKLVPGLYQRECKSLVEFEEQHRELVADAEDVLRAQQQQEQQQPEFFSPGEPISLSLEYHPAMLKHCGAGDKPPVCYLQCPADLRVVHLKRFLCSKYDIDAENKHVEVEVTYEDEVLPPSFTLMDVGYCYQWKRHAPMAFRYRILLYDERATTTKNDVNNLSKVNQDIELSPAAATKPSGKSVTFADDVPRLLLQHATNKSTRSKATTKLAKTKQRSNQTILPNNKKEQLEDSVPSTFKSLRSNDMRYSDYSGTNPAPLLRVKSEPEPEEPSNICNLNIVVSIPQSAVDYADEGGFELKTANKKSPQSQSHLPKLKIELNSMKAKLLTMPKSAEARLEQTDDALPQHQLDLETYAKNIGLKPIEPAATVAVAVAPDPNASPMSSCSSSTNGSNGTTADASTSHRKRKKKHSKEPKDPNGKRKKLHAEISSQTDGKMKMKITTTHNHKAHKLDLKRSHSLAGGELAALHQQQQQQQQQAVTATTTSDALNRTLGEEARSINSLMGASNNNNNNNNSDKKELKLPASPPLPPSLFKAFKAAPTAPPATPTATATVAAVKPKPATQQQQQLQPKPAKLPQHNNNNNNSNRKPTLMPHFVVPQTPLRQAPLPAHHMQRYLSTPSSIASAANKQPKRSISLDETQQQQQLLLAKQPRLDYQQQQQQLNRLNAAKKQQNYNTQMRLYGPDMAKATTTTTPNSSNMPMLCPTLTITPRARNNNNNNIHGLTYPYAEQAMPALEIVRLAAAAAGTSATASSAATAAAAAAARLMGPPVALPRQNNKRASLSAAAQSPPLSMPAMVKSPPLSVALSAQRGNNNNNNLNLNNAAYRTSPPALINLRNPFPTKSKAAEAKKPATTTTTAATVAVANGVAGQTKTTLREFRPPTVTVTTTTAVATAAATSTTTTTATVAKDADILDLSAGRNNNNSNSNTKPAATSSSSSKSNKQSATTALNNNNNNSSSSSNSLEAALNKIKQNISNNNNSNSNNNNNSASTTATAAAAAAAGDDLQNLHMLSESATAREKISIKYENNKPKNALVRQQNASVRSIPNPSALAFRNQATPTPTAATAATVAAAAIAAKPLTVKADEQQHKSTPTTTTSQLSPGNNSNNNNASATSPRAIKKPTTIDQVAANLNIRAEAKAAALSVELPLTPTPPTATTTTATTTTKSPELEKTPSNNKAPSVTKTDVKATTTAATTKTTTATTTATPTTTAAAASVAVATATLPLPSLPKAANSVTSTESMSKPPVQIAATDTLASVASSA